MTIHQLKCPNCNAELEVEDGIDTFFCKYCGTKIIVDEQSDAVVKAKADIKLAEKEIERQRQEQAHEEHKAQLDNEQFKLFLKAILGIIAVGILVAVFLLIYVIPKYGI